MREEDELFEDCSKVTKMRRDQLWRDENEIVYWKKIWYLDHNLDILVVQLLGRVEDLNQGLIEEDDMTKEQNVLLEADCPAFLLQCICI